MNLKKSAAQVASEKHPYPDCFLKGVEWYQLGESFSANPYNEETNIGVLKSASWKAGYRWMWFQLLSRVL